MTRFDVYMEVAPDGAAMAHVPELPGCHASGPTGQAALDALKGRIGGYYEFLRRHGENVDRPGLIELEVKDVAQEGAPLKRGSKAALFAWDLQPMTLDEMRTRFFRRATYARKELLALVGDLPDEALDWKAGAEAMSIREILRHIGNAEEWYISRVVEPDTLPPEWERDDELPIFEFLDMERRTVFQRFRRLKANELKDIVTPTHFTHNRDEPWTARKALRRLCEHQMEHTEHIKEILAAYQREHG